MNSRKNWDQVILIWAIWITFYIQNQKNEWFFFQFITALIWIGWKTDISALKALSNVWIVFHFMIEFKNRVNSNNTYKT